VRVLTPERKAGEFLGEMELDAGRRTDLVLNGNQVKPTLADLGLTKKESHRFQLLAGVPEVELVNLIAGLPEVTASAVIEGV